MTDKKSDQKGNCRKDFSGIAALFLLLIWCSNNVCAQQPQAAKAMVQKQAANPQQVPKYRVPAQILQIQMVSVPRLVGRKYDPENLPAALERVGLKLGKAVPVVNDQNIGIILSQSLPPRQQVRRNSVIDITFGVGSPPNQPGPERIVVPNYAGITLDEALRRIPNDSLTAAEPTAVPSDQPRGIIVGQFPPPGSLVDPFTRLILSYSEGPQQINQVVVPNLIGRSLQEAAGLLRQTGLFAGEVTGEVSEKEQGIVLKQSPEAGQKVDQRSSVDLTYSVQQQEILISVPDVTGLPLEEARQILHKNRLADLEEFVQRHGVPENRVIQQDPLPETKVPAGTEIHLLVSGKKLLPPWILWGGGLVAAILIGGFAGWKFGKGKSRKPSGEQAPEINLRLIPDRGEQTLIIKDDDTTPDGLNLKIVPDQGIQTLKIDEHEI